MMERPARSPSVPREAVRGLGRGVVATVVMSVPILLADRRKMGKPPPKRITEWFMARLGARPDSDTGRNLASTVAHLAFGATAGAVFSTARAVLRTPGPPLLHGLGYGVAVWASSYKGWIPALGILPPPEHDRPGRQRVIFVAHLVYGGVLGALEPSRPGGSAGARAAGPSASGPQFPALVPSRPSAGSPSASAAEPAG